MARDSPPKIVTIPPCAALADPPAFGPTVTNPRPTGPMRRAILALALTLPLVACQLSLPGRDRAPDPAATPGTGGTITTTSLDAPSAAAATAAPTTAPPPPPRPATAEAATEPPAPPIPEPIATPAPKSASQMACEDDGGTWVRSGESGLQTCILRTRDGGKRCDSRDDCDGECLARSRSCSPIKPLFGCNAVLMDTGAEVTLCID
ncbi:MAG: hypothetical protein RL216_816 [Pseudomonadota bacterium]